MTRTKLVIAVLLAAAASGRELRILDPPDGAILNRRDGETTATGLWITVKGEGAGAVRVNGVATRAASGKWEARVLLRAEENRITAESGAAKDAITVLWDRHSTPRYRVSLDDNIWFLRDIARKNYASIFDNPFLAMWREMHRKYGAKVHFNIYYETDGFNLSQMPDRYKEEWRRNADWIRLTFHARSNDPDRPYIKAPAEQVVRDYRQVTAEIIRFAGKELLSPVTTIHWGEATREACEALRKEGIKVLVGYFEFDGQGKPRVSYYLPEPRVRYLMGRDYWKDTTLDMLFVRHDMVMNSFKPEEIVPRLEKIAADPHQSEVIELMIHEQYYYPHYQAYEPDYRERVEAAIQWATKKGYKPAWFGEGFLGSQPRTGAFDTPVPKTRGEWDRRKTEARAKLRELLGKWPPLFTPKPAIESREQRAGYTLERIAYDNGAGDKVYGYVLVPEGRKSPGPAILYNHYHGGAYNNGKQELVRQAFKGISTVTGETLAREGYVVLGIDSYAFGERRFAGPAGHQEEGRFTETSLFKRFIWEGRTLWGMMVRDDLLALNYLLSRPDVDPTRVGTMGMSMGSTRSWWAAAMDDRIKSTVSVACLTRYQNLLAHGDVAQHGIYYFVPGMLDAGIDIETVVGLIAPRAHLTLTGDMDAGSPVDGVAIINDFQRKLYGLYGKPHAFRGMVYEGVGHSYTPEMWAETLAWFKKTL